MKVGVLSLQGDFEAHGTALERAGATPVYVRQREELEDLDGLVIPGGESTTMLKLMEYEDLMRPIQEFGRRKPMFGTCGIPLTRYSVLMIAWLGGMSKIGNSDGGSTREICSTQ